MYKHSLLFLVLASLTQTTWAATAGAPSQQPIINLPTTPTLTNTANPSPAPPTGGPNYPFGFIEGGGDYNYLTQNNPPWDGGYLLTSITTSPVNTWGAEFDHQFEFGGQDSFFTVSNTHTINDLWFSNISIGGSGDGYFWPYYEGNAFINKKWLSELNLITTLGYDRYDYRSTAYTNNGFFGASYYFGTWAAEGGINVYQNQPDSVWGENQYFALTQGVDGSHFYVLRYEFGHEAYAVSSHNTAITDFPYQLVSLTWRQWLSPTWGFNIRGEYFLAQPQYYNREGFWVGIFKTFG